MRGGALALVRSAARLALTPGGRHRQTWRRFESCSTLEELLLFARSLPCTPLGKLHLVNVTMSPHVTLDLQSQLGLTLQRLDLWPAGHIRVQAA